ncbi:MAG TPA: alkaline phosphatase family protein [Pyrinomonadaceae bacterium]|nr:alkaline phosphatase family protein [Pyrinomonadaceae bacterium]
MTSPNNQLNRIDHIVVLMLENRSFDNILGWLYDPGNPPPFDKVPRGQSFEGVSGKDLSNPRPGGGVATVGKETVMTNPFPDPNEPYDQVYAQMFNQTPPPTPIPDPTEPPNMQGFVINYAEAINVASTAKVGLPDPPDPGIIMNCFTPETLPVINSLANAYAVCDHWFSSVPTQTFPNRSFVHAATSSGYVYNFWKTGRHLWDVGILVNRTPTIYNLLEEADVSWKIYHGGPFLLCNAFLIEEQLRKFVLFDKHFFPMEQFLKDAKRKGGLPAYSFVEPNMMCSDKYGPENDMHPAYAITNTGAPTNVLYGEQLIYTVYKALRESPDWDSTLLIITFDEHGGCYDHVPPSPAAIPPDDVVVPPSEPGGSGFTFNRYGVRVPAVLVSPFIEQGTVCNTVFDHTSIIRTASKRWLDGRHLTNRDKNAVDVSEVLTLDKPRTDTPEITPRPVTFTGCGDQPLSGMHRHLLAAAARRLAQGAGELIDLHQIHTTNDAVNVLDEKEERVRSR